MNQHKRRLFSLFMTTLTFIILFVFLVFNLQRSTAVAQVAETVKTISGIRLPDASPPPSELGATSVHVPGEAKCAFAYPESEWNVYNCYMDADGTYGFTIAGATKVKITTASGSWWTNPLYSAVGPDGYSWQLSTCTMLAPAFAEAAFMARDANYNWQLVGSGTTDFNYPVTTIEFAANDCPGYYGNNGGRVTFSLWLGTAATPTPTPGMPDRPYNLSPSNDVLYANGGVSTLYWSIGANVDTCTVELFFPDGSMSKKERTYDTNYYIGPLYQPGSYRWQVECYNTMGAYSGWVTEYFRIAEPAPTPTDTPTQSTLPDKPYNLQPDDMLWAGNTIVLTWNTGANVDTCTVELFYPDGYLVKKERTTDKFFDVGVLPFGIYQWQVECYNNTGSYSGWVTARIDLIEQTTPTPQPTIIPEGYWRGEYFNNFGLSGQPALVRDDYAIDFAWENGSPDPIINIDFSARWTRRVNFTEGLYRFAALHDDGAKLWIDDNLILDKWNTCCTTDYVETNISNGWHVVRMELVDTNGWASAKLTWELLNTPFDGAELESQGDYTTVDPGTNVQIWINVRNSGTTTWRASDGYGWRGTGQWDGRSDSVWRDVMPGDKLSFSENIVAPQQPGEYIYGFILQHNGNDFGLHFFIKVTVASAFQVNPNGYSFTNFDYSGADWEQFKKAFPNSQMELLDGSKRKGAELFFHQHYEKSGKGGNCTGFTSTSLIDFLHLPADIEKTLMSEANRKINPIFNLNETDDVKDYIHLFQARQMSKEYSNWRAAHWNDTPKQTFEAVASKIQSGEPVGVEMFVPGQGHSVLGYRTEQANSIGYIYIYDNNWPNDSSRKISVNLETLEWKYDIFPGTDWSSKTGLLYAPSSINFPASLPTSFDNAISAAANQSDSNILVSIQGLTNYYVTDSQGRRLGYVNDTFVNEIPNGYPQWEAAFNPAHPNARGVEFFVLPAGSYNVELKGADNNRQYDFVAFGNGSGMLFNDVKIDSNGTDHIQLAQTVLDTSIQSSSDNQVCQYLTQEIGESASRDYLTCITGVVGVAANFQLDPSNTNLSVMNQTTLSVSVTSSVNQIGTGSGSNAVEQQLAPGERVTIKGISQNSVYLPLVTR